MKETDKQYYSRRGKEEQERSETATCSESESIHAELADLCYERGNRSANVNSKSGIRSQNDA